MAWHANKPSLSDTVAQATQYTRENFAELEPLQPHVTELVDLTAHVTELIDLTTLHPHIAALLNSRIVDHNLDVPSPPNGYYVRYANGVQVCFASINIPTTTSFSSETYQGVEILSFPATWILPADMIYFTAHLDLGYFNYDAEPGDIRSYVGLHSVRLIEGAGLVSAEVSLLKPTPFDGRIYSIPAFWSATGRWY